MTDVKPLDAKKEDNRNILKKLSDAVPDRDEQLVIVGAAVRLGVLVWSGLILTTAYVKIPGIAEQKFDPTFIASIFTSCLASWGIQTQKKGNGGVSKEDMEKMIAKSNGGTEQIIRVQTPLTINGAEVVRTDPITGKEIDPTTGKLT
jgi:hypothetical protein